MESSRRAPRLASARARIARMACSGSEFQTTQRRSKSRVNCIPNRVDRRRVHAAGALPESRGIPKLFSPEELVDRGLRVQSPTSNTRPETQPPRNSSMMVALTEDARRGVTFRQARGRPCRPDTDPTGPGGKRRKYYLILGLRNSVSGCNSRRSVPIPTQLGSPAIWPRSQDFPSTVDNLLNVGLRASV